MGKASEWRAKSRDLARSGAVELELPSGMKILARRPDVLTLAACEMLPFSLAAAVASSQNGNGAGAETKVVDLALSMQRILTYCCVEPRISLDPKGDDEIHPREICQEDWAFILKWAQRSDEAAGLEGFRGERPDAGSGGDRAEIRPTPLDASID